MIKNAKNSGKTRFNPFSSTGNSFGLGVLFSFSFSFLGPEQKREKNSGWNLSDPRVLFLAPAMSHTD